MANRAPGGHGVVKVSATHQGGFFAYEYKNINTSFLLLGTFTFAIDKLVAGEVVEEGVNGVELSDLVFLLNVEHIPLRSQLHSHQTKQTRTWGTIQKNEQKMDIKIDKNKINKNKILLQHKYDLKRTGQCY